MNDRKFLMKKKINGDNLVLLKQPPQRDYTHTMIIAFATIISAFIVSRRK